MGNRTVHFYVTEQVTHAVELDLDDPYVRERISGAGYDPDDTAQVRQWLSELDTDDALIANKVGDGTVAAIDERDVDGLSAHFTTAQPRTGR